MIHWAEIGVLFLIVGLMLVFDAIPSMIARIKYIGDSAKQNLLAAYSWCATWGGFVLIGCMILYGGSDFIRSLFVYSFICFLFYAVPWTIRKITTIVLSLLNVSPSSIEEIIESIMAFCWFGLLYMVFLGPLSLSDMDKIIEGMLLGTLVLMLSIITKPYLVVGICIIAAIIYAKNSIIKAIEGQSEKKSNSNVQNDDDNDDDEDNEDYFGEIDRQP